MAHPTAQADQVHAATTDARRRLTTIAAASGQHLTTTGDPTGWLAGQAARCLAALTGPGARLCPHIGTSPHVVHAAVWAPGLLVCPTCTHLLRPTATEDRTCDRCRRTLTGLYPAMAALGPVLLTYGLCSPCQNATGLTAPRTPVEGAPPPRHHARPPRRHRRHPPRR
ncbi:hypothetical protein [Candidatus Frankia nodulisporulans]|uniref:hypothetical protein n=2 Tax=Candidatus Frankia nodulisporulans TaxID=2060052 RepID=UPI001582AD68|nr:hypothetical protein [Candidatus Frankia nodulisporulans]